MRNWHVQFIVLLVVQFISAAGFTVAQPFVPLYIQELGVASIREAAVWAGIHGAVGGLVLALASPIWGVVADRYGRKLMVERATIGAAIFQGGMGLVRSVQQFVLLRGAQSLVSGVQAAVMALTAATVPQQSLGFAMGAQQTALALGSVLGPFVGGWMATGLGYRPTFFVTGALLLVAGLLTFFAVHEDFTPPPRGKDTPGPWSSLHQVLTIPKVPILLSVIALGRSANTGMVILIPLILQEMAGGSREVSGIAGTVVGLTAIAMAIGAVLWGRLGDRVGQVRILLLCLGLSAVLIAPQVLVQAPWQLAVGQMLYSAMLAGLLPTTNALISIIGPQGQHGVIYGASGTALAIGNGLGPIIAAAVIALFGTRAMFVGIGLVLLVLYVALRGSAAQLTAAMAPCPRHDIT